MTGAISWGLLGTAHVNQRLIPAMRAARRSTIAAVASREPSRAAAYAAKWGIPAVHGGYDALLRDPHVDAVYVPLPNALHVEWTLRALDADKHVLCEKPLALAPDDVERIAAVARGRGLVVAEAFMYRHEPLIARVLDLLHHDRIGAVQHVSAGFTYAQTRSPDVRLDPRLGGGSLWDVGCYAVNVARVVVGTEPVEASGFAAMTTAGVDAAFTGLLRFPNDVTAAIYCSFRSAYRTWLEVAGTAGVLRVERPFRPEPQEQIEIHRGESVTRVIVDGSPLLFVRQIEDFVGAALDGTAPLVSLGDSRGNAAALAALYEAARGAKAVTI